MENLPVEIKECILLYLEPVDLTKVFVTCKSMSCMDTNLLWNKLLSKHYKINSNKPKIKYIKCFKTLCRECNRKTNNYNDFFNIKICKQCETKIPKYNLVTYTQAIKEYFLNDKILNSMKYINRRNNYNSKRPLKLYLRNDLNKYISNNKKYIQKKIYENNEKKIRKYNILKNRYTVFMNILVHIYNFNFIVIILLRYSDIESYSRFTFTKYFKTISIKNNANKSTNIIKKILELNFIDKYTLLNWRNFESFEDLMFYFLIYNDGAKMYPLNINKYIDEKIRECYCKYKDIFKRKLEVQMMIRGTSLEHIDIFENNILKQYIYLGIDEMKKIKNSGEGWLLYNDKNFFNKEINKDIKKFINNFIEYPDYDFILENNDPKKRLFVLAELENFAITKTRANIIIFSNYLKNMVYFNRINIYIIELRKWYYKNTHLSFKIPNNLFKFIL